MFDYHKYFRKILLISGLGFIIYGILQPTGETIIGARIIVGAINLTLFIISKRLDKEWMSFILIMELYLLTPYAFYISYISEHDPLLMVFTIIIYFSGTFLFLNSRSGTVYLLFNGVNLLLYLVASSFAKESVIIAFLFVVMYFFVSIIHKSFLNSIERIKKKELDAEDSFYWMAKAVNSPLARISGLIYLFELGENLDTSKIRDEIQSIKDELHDLEDRLVK